MRRTRGSKPALGYVLELITEGRAQYALHHQQCNILDDICYNRHEVELPDIYKTTKEIVRSGIGEDQLRRSWTLCVSAQPTFGQVPLGLGDSANEQSTLITSFLNSLFPMMEKQQNDTTYANLVWNALEYGGTFAELVYLPDAWSEYTEQQAQPRRKGEKAADRKRRLENLKKTQPVPFLFRDLDPRSVYAFYDEQGIREVLIGFRRRRTVIAQEYSDSVFVGYDSNGQPALQKLQPGDLGEGVPIGANQYPLTTAGQTEFFTYYNDTYCVHIADGIFVDKPYEHHFGRVPVFEATGITTSSRQPHERYRSIISPVAPMVPVIDSYLTLMHNQAIYTGFPAWVVEQEYNPDGSLPDDLPQQPAPVVPGMFNFLSPGQHVKELPMEPAQVVTQQLQLLLQFVRDENAVAAILKGVAPGADASGYQIRELMDKAKTIQRQALASLSTMYEQAAACILRFIDTQIQEDVFLLGVDPKDRRKRAKALVGVGPQDIKGYYQVYCSIETNSAMDSVTMWRLGDELTRSKFVSHRYALEQFGKVNDPELMRDEITLESIEQSPKIAELLAHKVIQMAGLDQLIQQATGGQAPPGIPGPGGGAPLSPPPGAPPPPPGVMNGTMPQMEPQMPAPPTIGPGMGEPPPGMGGMTGVAQVPPVPMPAGG